jgi:site-specific recombinase XerD
MSLLGNKPATISRKIVILKSFFKFLVDIEVLNQNIMASIRTPKIPQKEKTIPSEEEFNRIMQYYEQIYTDKINTLKQLIERLNTAPRHDRDILITKHQAQIEKWISFRDEGTLLVRFLYSTMARCVEVINLKVRDLDLEKDQAKVRGKGNKERVIFFDRETARLMKEKISRRGLSLESYLFTNPKGQKFKYANAIQSRVRTIRRNLELEKTWNNKLTPHFFRTVGASHLDWEGTPLTTLQDLLGHSSPETTRIYTKTNKGKMALEYLTNHPLNKKLKAEEPH